MLKNINSHPSAWLVNKVIVIQLDPIIFKKVDHKIVGDMHIIDLYSFPRKHQIRWHDEYIFLTIV